jgi:uracil-DNA glycosylase family protein
MKTAPAGPGARHFFPSRITWRALREAARGCRGCPLYKNATQTVFGEGPRTARLVFVGEVPGNDEDLEGHPFVGPAGRLLGEGLDAAGIDRRDVYLTNVVKHFKWVPVGRRRKHKKPLAREINACFPWLEKELELIRPRVLVCLGATAAQSVLARDFKVTRMRGRVISSPLAERAMATVHPSSILRQRTSEDRRREWAGFVCDLEVAAGLLHAKS